MNDQQPMRVSDLRALIQGVSDDAWVTIADEDGHASPVSWHVHQTSTGEPQSVVLMAAKPDEVLS